MAAFCMDCKRSMQGVRECLPPRDVRLPGETSYSAIPARPGRALLYEACWPTRKPSSVTDAAQLMTITTSSTPTYVKPPRTSTSGKELHGFQSTKGYAWKRRKKRRLEDEAEEANSVGKPVQQKAFCVPAPDWARLSCHGQFHGRSRDRHSISRFRFHGRLTSPRRFHGRLTSQF